VDGPGGEVNSSTDRARRSFAKAFAEEAGTSLGRAVAMLATGGVSGALAFSHRHRPGVVLVLATLVALWATGLCLAIVLRVPLTRLLRRYRSRSRRLARRNEWLQLSLRGEREEMTKLRQAVDARITQDRHLRELADGLKTALSDARRTADERLRELTALRAYGAIRAEILATVREECVDSTATVDRDRVLDGVLNGARSGLCQIRAAATRLAVVEDIPDGHKVRHSAGILPRHVEDSRRSLADIAAAMGECSLIVDFGPDKTYHLMLVGDGSLDSRDCEFAREIAGIYALADVALKVRIG
jgi:hypothetical protein